MTTQELAKIFDETSAEILADFDVAKMSKEFESKFGVPQLSAEDGAKIGGVLALSMRLNQEFFFRVLSKILCGQKNP